MPNQKPQTSGGPETIENIESKTNQNPISRGSASFSYQASARGLKVKLGYVCTGEGSGFSATKHEKIYSCRAVMLLQIRQGGNEWLLLRRVALALPGVRAGRWRALMPRGPEA